jgi:hypothetical protein
MKAFLAACVVAIVGAIAAAQFLETRQASVDSSFTSANGVRLGDYGKPKP